MTLLDDISPSIGFVRNWLGERTPQLAIVLGSGLAAVPELLVDGRFLAYTDIPNFTATRVSGHSGCLYSGTLFGHQVLIFQGRYHCYEGYSAWQVTAPVRLAAELGCGKIILTNAAGGIADEMQAGDFMLVTDHLNLVGENPLRGRPELDFIDATGLYCSEFYPSLQQSLQQKGITLHAGVLAWMLGPSYETPAEICFLKNAGASAVSMSTIPEALVARFLGLETVAVSSISNLAAGKSTTVLDHRDVLTAGQRSASSLSCLLQQLLSTWIV